MSKQNYVVVDSQFQKIRGVYRTKSPRKAVKLVYERINGHKMDVHHGLKYSRVLNAYLSYVVYLVPMTNDKFDKWSVNKLDKDFTLVSGGPYWPVVGTFHGVNR